MKILKVIKKNFEIFNENFKFKINKIQQKKVTTLKTIVFRGGGNDFPVPTPGGATATANAKSKFFGENLRFNSSFMQSRAKVL